MYHLHKNQFLASYCTATGVWLSSVIISTLLFQIGIFLLGGTISCWSLAGAVVLSTLLTYLHSHDTRSALIGSLIGITVSSLAIIASSFIEDYSFDGNSYHQMAIACMLDGWNPYYDTTTGSLWVDHYAKGIEIIEAVFASSAQSIEAGKGLNIMLVGATMFLCISIAMHWGLNRRQSIFTALILGLSPVSMAQLPTFYIDYAKCCFDALIIIFIIQALNGNRQRTAWILLIGTGITASLSKFNFFFETGLILIITLIWLTIQHRYTYVVKVLYAGLSVLILTFMLGYHPYINNWINMGHPLYPLMGENSVDIMTSNETLAGDITGWRVWDFIKSLFHFQAIATVDTRMGGFSILMPLILATCFIAIWKNRNTISSAQWWLLGCILGSCFIFSQSWWARYISQLWLIVPLSAAIAWRNGKSRIAASITTMAILAGLWAFGGTMTRSAMCTCYRHTIYSQLKDKETTVYRSNPQTLRHLRDHNILCKTAGDCVSDDIQLVYFFGDTAVDCGAMIQLHCNVSKLRESLPSPMHDYFNKRIPSTK